MHIDEKIYEHLFDIPSFEEWLNTIKRMPNGKASGVSQISYEMLKHLSTDFQNVLYNFICQCLQLNLMPSQWKEVIIYPIPKPKPFNAQLMNTHPITLLDTVRKTLISLFNQRFTNILKDHDVL